MSGLQIHSPLTKINVKWGLSFSEQSYVRKKLIYIYIKANHPKCTLKMKSGSMSAKLQIDFRVYDDVIPVGMSSRCVSKEFYNTESV